MFPDLLWNPLLCLKSSIWFLRKCRNRKWETKTTSFRIHVYIKKKAGFTQVARVPSRPAGSTGFHRANSPTGFFLDPDRSQAQVGRVSGRPARLVRVLKLWQQAFFFSWLFVFLSFNLICVEKERRKLNLWSCKIIYCRQTKKLWIMNLNLKLGRALWRSNKQWAFILD